jgi:hypothetical protein
MISTIGTPRQTSADRALAEFELLYSTTMDMIAIEAAADRYGRLTEAQQRSMRVARNGRGGAVLMLLSWGVPVELLAAITDLSEN